MEWELITESDTFIMATRLVLAAFLGGLIGVEREFHQHPAGFRTHLLVSAGSCLIMLLAFFGFQNYINENPEVVNFDPSRLAAYVVSGIGFLGAGTILVQGYTVRGLTTAASIWVVAGIGLTVGAGLYTPAIITTVLVLVSLHVLAKVNFAFLSKQKKHFISITVDEETGRLNDLIRELEMVNVKIKGIQTEKHQLYNEKPMIEYRLLVEYTDHKDIATVSDRLHKYDFVKQMTMGGK
jgi:putative Mg2+ transporter-C (MgtC) family protein